MIDIIIEEIGVDRLAARLGITKDRLYVVRKAAKQSPDQARVIPSSWRAVLLEEAALAGFPVIHERHFIYTGEPLTEAEKAARMREVRPLSPDMKEQYCEYMREG